MVGAHHDDIFFTTYPDLEALDKITSLIKYLEEKNPEYRLTVAEILNAAQIEH